MDLLSVSLALFFLIVTYVLFERYIQGDNYERITENGASMNGNPGGEGSVSERAATEGGMIAPSVNGQVADSPVGDNKIVKEVVYTQDYYPWWRTPRNWSYDGNIFNMPYYNYWRRPQYRHYWASGRPLVVDGKIYYSIQ